MKTHPVWSLCLLLALCILSKAIWAQEGPQVFTLPDA
jgi:hypothetical protein